MNIKNVLMGAINDYDLLRYLNAKIFYKKLVPEIQGYVFLHRGYFYIVINKYQPYEDIKYTILHELAHIELNQLDQVNTDYLIAFCRESLEDEADMYIKNILDELN